MNVYHGSTLQVNHPIAEACRDNLDFGKGFYVTDLQEQAVSWANRVSLIQNKTPWLNIYQLDIDVVLHNYRTLHFQAYDREWLDFVVANRRGSELWKQYDLIEGGIANDRVFNTIELFFSGLIPQEEALKRLSYEKPNNQLCLINQELINCCLHFTEAFQLNKEGGQYVASK